MRYCHEVVRKAFADWILINELDVRNHYRCIMRYLRGNRLFPASRFQWDTMLKKQCYHNTSMGPVAAWDGEFIFDNPRFVNRDKAFSLQDTELRIDDLLPWGDG